MTTSPTPTTGDLALSTERPLEGHQPFVHDLTGVFHAPIQAWSDTSGTIPGRGATGAYIGDTRVLSALRCVADGAELSPLAAQVHSARKVTYRDVVSLPDGIVDPIVTLHRTRTADADGIQEEIRLVSDDTRPRQLRLRLGLVTDGVTMSAVKDPRLVPAEQLTRPLPRVGARSAEWSVGAAGGLARLDIGERGEELSADDALVTWEVTLDAPPHGEDSVTWRLDLTDPTVPFVAPSSPWAAATPDANTSDPETSPELRAARTLLRRSLSDLDALRLQAPGGADQSFFAAGAPWFFTLFGRDSLITASLVLPLDVSLAESTLRTLAARQGSVVDPETAEHPGKILHEVRAAGMEMADSHLPPVYYGTIDATPLWIELLHDAREAGLGDRALTELAPHLERAAHWLLEHADADGDGFLEYIDESGHGLANQGWKDSGDSIRFADGTLAEGTIALVEVQGYAYAAALHAASLLEDPCLDGSSDLPNRLRSWATELKERFHRAYWCEDELGPYPALALDGTKTPVDGVASNMGHLLGTGLLSEEQERIVVGRLLDPSMFSGFGVRTLSTTNGGYGPLRYHGGSVWTHDTGYILRGMLRSGHDSAAQVLARGLLKAAEGFDHRLPELFSGEGTDSLDAPVPYPASCRPQAWAAASAVPIAQALGIL